MIFVKHKTLAKIAALFCIASITALASISQAVEVGCGGEHCDKHQRHNFKRFEKKLGLTEAQKLQTKAILQRDEEAVEPIITSLHAEQKNLRAMIYAETIDVAAIRGETAKIAGIQAGLNVERAKIEAQFRGILTPAQLVILKSLHK